MRRLEILRTVMISILSNKFRVFLTSLGIIIGTLTIILVVGIGRAGETAVAEQYSRLSVESITISRVKGMGQSAAPTEILNKDDAMLMSEVLPNVKSIGVSTKVLTDIGANGASSAITIQGINEEYAEITRLHVAYGVMLTNEDSMMRNKYVVLGSNVAAAFFDGDLAGAVGEKVLIKGSSFEVIGVLDSVGGSGGISTSQADSGSVDDMAFIPYDVAVKYTTGSTSRNMSSSANQVSYIALANDINSVDLAMEEIKEYIVETIGTGDAYTVTDAGNVLESAQATAKTLSSLLLAVAVIVLVVSGIGIMNVLMVAVKERTREIGILKSIGASRKTIMIEFLLEAAAISVFGGILGALMSLAAPWIFSMSTIAFEPSVEGILLGIGFSVLTGIFFGFYPAAKASGLEPIVALNYE
ncbi:ABC transporter permease [Alkalibacter rhizosphaerae]|uniref:ABC transporter permease n=1 Tax=Alkalibacter rhizosphaerae TaxID=2815577 RepID=A0A974XM79_9FIRM|nr:ABC transporter permease [Alkalibacter rhizosphaerae]QSX08506.1 ABC transporter permease [Alkalibacter rhizosphaerae]